MSQRYELLFECFISQQMSAAQLREHMDADDVFKRFVEKKLRSFEFRG